MATHLVIVDRRSDFATERGDIQVLTAREYIARPEMIHQRAPRVINLCRSYRYLGAGYYCSLLAEARSHKIIPSVKTILDLSQKTLYRHALPELQELIGRRIARLSAPPEVSFALHVFFGRADDNRFQEVARRAFDLFRAPILKLSIRLKNGWNLHSIEAVPVTDLTAEQRSQFMAALEAYAKASWREPTERRATRYSLAILHNPKEELPPSSPRTLQKFVRTGENLGLTVELIEKKDYLRLAEFDALFIRETTSLDHHTYRFAKKAEKEGMPVIDDPNSILKCTNKVYLAELLRAHHVPAPKTVILDKTKLATLEQELSYPLVLKIPDGSFSRGVYKVKNRTELEAQAASLFEESDVILAQEYMYTDFDWRVGILNREPIYVCQYLMAKKHWQIVKHGTDGRVQQGSFHTLPVESAPREVVDVAVKAAGLIGNGLYGVDVKQNDRGVFVIEINDNPSIDAGVEDFCLKDDLYKIIMKEFVRRIEGRASQDPPRK